MNYRTLFGTLTKNEKVEKIPFDPKWSGGAPIPFLLQSELRTFLTYYVEDIDPNWDGTYVKVQDPTSPEVNKIAIVEWQRCRGASLGGLNDEAIHGHKLWDKGLSECGYGAGIVKNSRWIEELKMANRVHEYHKDEMFDVLNHYILIFHDTTFECIAKSFTVEVVNDSMPNVLNYVVEKLT